MMDAWYGERQQTLGRARRIDEKSGRLIEMAMGRLGLSAHAYTRVLKVTRIITDLDGRRSAIGSSYAAEAIQYRSLDRRVI